MNYIRTSSKSRKQDKFGEAGTSSTSVSGLPPQDLCPSFSPSCCFSELIIKNAASTGKYFCHFLHSFLASPPHDSDSFQKSKASIHTAAFPAMAPLCQQNSQQQHTQGADFRGAKFCFDRGLSILHLL